MFFANTLAQDKGLFTFYRQQAEIQESLALKANQNTNNLAMADNQIQKIIRSQNPNSKYKTKRKISYEKINQDLIRRLSLKNQQLLNESKNQIEPEIIVIKKGISSKQQDNIKLNRLNLRYEMHDGYFVKERKFQPLPQSSISNEYITERSFLNREQDQSKKTILKRNRSINKSQILSPPRVYQELLSARKLKTNRENASYCRFEGLKRVNLQAELSTQKQKDVHLVHRRIPPKVLASILKSGNNEMIKHLRKQLQRQREEQIKKSFHQRQHCFVEYNSCQYNKSGLDNYKLNEKQRRLITILNKFNRKPFINVLNQ